MTLRLALVSAALGASLLVSAVASADPTVKELAQAKDLFTKGRADELAAQYAQGLQKFEAVEKIKSRSAVVFHIAFCKEKLGRLLEAADDYDRAKAMAKAEGKPDVLREVEARSTALAQRLPKLVVVVPPGTADVKVLVDERPLPESDWGLEKRVAPGSHKVEATAPNVPPFRANVETPERSTQEIKIVFQAPSPSPAAVAVAPVPVPAGTTQTPSSSEPSKATADLSSVTPPPDRGPQKHANYTGAIVASVAVGAFAGLGLVSFLVAGAKHDTLVTQCPTLTTEACADLRGPVRTWDTVALAGFGAAGVSLVTAIVLFATASPSRNAAAVEPNRLGLFAAKRRSGHPGILDALALEPDVAFGPSTAAVGLRGVLP